MPIKSYRGKIADLGTETIALHTNDGTTGYKIRKFELMSTQPGQVDGEHIMQIFTIPKTDTSLYDNIDFSDQTLIGCGYISTDTSEVNADSRTIIFDNITFNQDIYLTHADVKGALPVNYHIELEQVKLDLNESTAATLKDMRNTS